MGADAGRMNNSCAAEPNRGSASPLLGWTEAIRSYEHPRVKFKLCLQGPIVLWGRDTGDSGISYGGLPRLLPYPKIIRCSLQLNF